jgi:hypothetical protein
MTRSPRKPTWRITTRKGFRVLRFNDHDVMTNRDGVLTTIAAVLGEAVAPSLPSSASGGGGGARVENGGEASP